jgi:hypothetical protein
MYLSVVPSISMTFIFIPIRPSRRDPESDEIEDAED